MRRESSRRRPWFCVPKPPPAVPAGPRIRKTWLIAGLLSLAVLAGVGIVWWLSSADGTVHYTTAPVTRGAVTRTVTATGTVNPVLTIIVGTYVSGVIQRLYCDYNTQVKKGQICAKIDPRPYQTVVDQNKANLAVAKAQLEKDKASLDLCASSTTIAMRRLARPMRSPRTRSTMPRTPTIRRRRRSASTRPHPAARGRARRRAGQSRLHQHRLAGGRHRGVAQRHHGADGRRELPDPDAVPDRDRPHQDAGRHQCERERHRRHQGRRQGDLHRRCVSRSAPSTAP